MITDRSGKARALATELFCTYAEPTTIAASCDRIFLAVKPQMMREALTPLRPYLQDRKPLLITMAAGLTITKIQELAGAELPVIRIMPNTPVQVGKGMTLYCCYDMVEESVLENFLEDMAFTGRMDEIAEHLIDSAGVVSGCGPAYMYMFAEALADGAVACGVPRAKALEYAAATLSGAGEVLALRG
jgi:pyrroline-5-carboxylate reductase